MITKILFTKFNQMFNFSTKRRFISIKFNFSMKHFFDELDVKFVETHAMVRQMLTSFSMIPF